MYTLTLEDKSVIEFIKQNKAIVEKIMNMEFKEMKRAGDLKIGDCIKVAGINWRVFVTKDGFPGMLADDITCKMKFGDNSNWLESDIRNKYLKEIEQKISTELGDDALVPITGDLLSMDGSINYGCYVDNVSILSLDLYRNNRLNIKDIGKSFWTNTPDSNVNSYVRFVCSGGNVDCIGCYWSDFGVRPFFILNSSIFVSLKEE